MRSPDLHGHPITGDRPGANHRLARRGGRVPRHPTPTAGWRAELECARYPHRGPTTISGHRDSPPARPVMSSPWPSPCALRSPAPWPSRDSDTDSHGRRSISVRRRCPTGGPCIPDRAGPHAQHHQRRCGALDKSAFTGTKNSSPGGISTWKQCGVQLNRRCLHVDWDSYGACGVDMR